MGFSRTRGLFAACFVLLDTARSCDDLAMGRGLDRHIADARGSRNRGIGDDMSPAMLC